MPSRDGGAILRARDDHFEQAEPELLTLADGSYAMAVRCTWTDAAVPTHITYLRPGPRGTVIADKREYGWPNMTDAYAARGAWARQQQREGGDG